MLRCFAIRARGWTLQDWDLLLTDARVATMTSGNAPYGLLDEAAIGIANGRISWVGKAADLPPARIVATRSIGGRCITPALIDCHTHLVFSGDRAAEFAQRLAGSTYAEIAAAGGGIMSTVRATRAADSETLLEESALRLDTLRREGCGTVEIKSGYGLDTDAERKMLDVISMLAASSRISVAATFLGAHAIPAEFRGKSDAYIDKVCGDMLPLVAENELAQAVDAYCESIAFSARQVERVFTRAQELGLPVKLHADQLSDCGGAELAASFSALSADHLEYTSDKGIQAMADSGTVAVLLPGAFLTLGETQQPPVEQLRDHAVPIAIATDCNPGSSPLCSIRTAMALATSLFKLTPEECLAGVTRNAAAALGLSHDRGTIEPGKRADLAIWDVDHPQVLSYWMGMNELNELLIGGETL